MTTHALPGRAAVFLVVAAACISAQPHPLAPPPVLPGIDVLAADIPPILAGKRIGLITNHTGIDHVGMSTIDILDAATEFDLVALFSPEHGIRGTAAPGEAIDSGVDERSGLPIHSLYGDTRKPTPAMLHGLDALVFDIQDIGTRTYTYVYTMALAMQAAAEKGIPFVVLDRPNPINGVTVEGNLLDAAFASFVGMYPIPIRHGMTAGELAKLFNSEFGIGANLTVVPVSGWTRNQWFDDTELPWISPSPNIRRLEAAIHYPGTVFLEGTNLSEGRGTDFPFEQTGAPWLRADAVAAAMNAMRLPGVRFESVEITTDPSTPKFPGQTIPGVRLILTDRESYRPVNAALLMIDLIRRMHPDDFAWSGSLDRLAGTDRLRLAMEAGTLPDLLAGWERDAAGFAESRKRHLIY
ncbi:MAG: exo-beta-N-acetylmuramidase NamZ family protein [Gemmatimonadaceae bacterium]